MYIVSAGLDYQSQEPLIFTDDKYLNDSPLNPLHEHEREILLQAGGHITRNISGLTAGVNININGKIYLTKNAFSI